AREQGPQRALETPNAPEPPTCLRLRGPARRRRGQAEGPSGGEPCDRALLARGLGSPESGTIPHRVHAWGRRLALRSPACDELASLGVVVVRRSEQPQHLVRGLKAVA